MKQENGGSFVVCTDRWGCVEEVEVKEVFVRCFPPLTAQRKELWVSQKGSPDGLNVTARTPPRRDKTIFFCVGFQSLSPGSLAVPLSIDRTDIIPSEEDHSVNLLDFFISESQ